MVNPLSSAATGWTADKKNRIAIVGTGSRSHGMWSKSVLDAYGDKVEFVGLCDINPGRVESFKKSTGFTCPGSERSLSAAEAPVFYTACTM